jgi:putative oxidoreductase
MYVQTVTSTLTDRRPAMTTRTDSSRLDLALTVLRVIVGAVFVAHGAQKLFVFGMAGVQGAFGQMGIPLASVTGPAVALVEFFGGLALIVGLLTRLAGFGLAITMLGAIVFAHLPEGFFAPKGYEFPLTLLGATAALALAGAGRFSLDHVLASRRGAASPALAGQPTARAGQRVA